MRCPTECQYNKAKPYVLNWILSCELVTARLLIPNCVLYPVLHGVAAQMEGAIIAVPSDGLQQDPALTHYRLIGSSAFASLS